MILRTFIILMLLVTFAGCTSMTSSLLNRDDYDGFSRNTEKAVKGIPITVQVPTHLKVWIEEEYYIQNNKDGVLELLETGKPVISVVNTFDFEEKLFTVDFKRPGAGTLQTDIKLDSEKQYFKQIHSKIVDNTIQDITKVVEQFAAPLGIKTSVGDNIKNNLIVDTRTVAFARFDINAPDFELQLADFFDHHINNCNSCRGFECPSVNPVGYSESSPIENFPIAEERGLIRVARDQFESRPKNRTRQ